MFLSWDSKLNGVAFIGKNSYNRNLRRSAGKGGTNYDYPGHTEAKMGSQARIYYFTEISVIWGNKVDDIKLKEWKRKNDLVSINDDA